jgi:hypothetical protein
MTRLFRLFFAPVILLITSASLVVVPGLMAQPPGSEKGKGFQKGKGFEKSKRFEKEGEFDLQAEKAKPTPTEEALKNLEADLARLKALEADIQSQLNKLKEAPLAPPEDTKGSPTPQGPGGFGQGGPGGFSGAAGGGGFGGPGFQGKFGGGGGGFGKGGPNGFPGGGGFGQGVPGFQGGAAGGGGGFGQGGPGFQGGPGPGNRVGGPGALRASQLLAQSLTRTFRSLTAEQLKEIIDELQRIRDEKLRAAPAPRPVESPSDAEGRKGPGGAQSAASAASQNEEILKRLDRLTQELDVIRRSLSRPTGKDRGKDQE